MGRLIDALAAWLCDNVRVPVDKVHSFVDECDTDGDGCISLGELVGLVSAWFRGLRR